MTTKADFTTEEWDVVLEAPPSAGLIVVTAQRGGTLRETVAMAKAYNEARRSHGASELLDEIVAAKPERDHTRYHSVDELHRNGASFRNEIVTGVGVKQILLQDPAGNLVELFEPLAAYHERSQPTGA